MGIITDIFRASSEKLAEYVARREEDAELDCLECFPGESLRQIGMLEFETLRDLLSPKRGQARRSAGAAGYEPVTDPEDLERIILRFPRAMVERLGRSGPEELSRLAAAWATTGGFATIGWAEGEVNGALQSLARLAKDALRDGEELFMAKAF